MGIKENMFFDLKLGSELMLDGYSTDFRTEKDFKRPVILGSFNVIWGSILFPGGPCGDLEMG